MRISLEKTTTNKPRLTKRKPLETAQATTCEQTRVPENLESKNITAKARTG